MTNKNLTIGELVFMNFVAIYGPKYKSSFSDESILKLTEQHWTDALKDIPMKKIKETILHCRDKFEWPPSIAEFKKLCMPTLQELNLPEPKKALQLFFSDFDEIEILNKLRKILDRSELGRMNSEMALTVFTKKYMELVEKDISTKWKENKQIKSDAQKGIMVQF